MDRIKKISLELLESHKEKFGTDFDHNKKILSEVAIVRSKELRNEIAGYITRLIKNEIDEQKAKEQREQAKAEELQQRQQQEQTEQVAATEPANPAAAGSEVEQIETEESDNTEDTVAGDQDTTGSQSGQEQQAQDDSESEVVTTTSR